MPWRGEKIIVLGVVLLLLLLLLLYILIFNLISFFLHLCWDLQPTLSIRSGGNPSDPSGLKADGSSLLSIATREEEIEEDEGFLAPRSSYGLDL
ncbi:hypothetical protein MUK42_03215 [Musa troglodytarum]|uniref:Uncharacterized protein n=1 Tax=Musa troglodytarum TaxID=320322 RepID=A0A9E7HKC3_9LILI|nr:hypothetical protein MUK42_03215 [Musa troglodytarum]